MGKHADSPETKALKKTSTQDFIRAVDGGGKKDGLKEIEHDFGIGGIVWCAYRRGARSLSFPSLRQKIKTAVEKRYILPAMGDKLLSQLPPLLQEVDLSSANHLSAPYTFDASLLFQSDVSRTAELLVKQIRQLRKRISYGNEGLEDVHFYTTSLNILDPVQTLIQEMLHEKQAEESRLKIEFGNDNYKEIEPIPSPRNASAYDVGYIQEWWLRSPPTPQEMEAMRIKIEVGTERELLKARQKRRNKRP